jgi:hypothetical protein
MICIKVEITSHIIFMTEGTLLTEEPFYMKNKYLKPISNTGINARYGTMI